MASQSHEPDAHVEQHGSIYLIEPVSDDAHRWLVDNVEGDALWYAGALAVDQHCARPIVQAMVANGFNVQ